MLAFYPAANIHMRQWTKKTLRKDFKDRLDKSSGESELTRSIYYNILIVPNVAGDSDAEDEDEDSGDDNNGNSFTFIVKPTCQ